MQVNIAVRPMPENEPQPYSELATFGEELRREREIRGISLKEIADSTKISKRFLDAIERNDHKTLPAPVFTRGFVREYARYLGLNADDMVNRYNYAAAGDDRIEKSAHLDRLVPERAEREVRPKSKATHIPSVFARVDRNIYFLIIIAAALAAMTVWAVKHRHITPAVDTTETARTETAAHTTSAAVPVAASPKTVPPAEQETLRMTIEFGDDSWLSLDADGRSVFNDDGRRGMKKTFEAKDRFRFRTIGNAAGLNITINDVHIPALGREGQVLHDVVFDREYLQRLQPTTTTGDRP
jgi:cytoskeletal protein RodZ